MGEIFHSTYNTRAIIPNSYRFIRSDIPTEITVSEVSWLIEQKVTTIVDLREEDERLRKPCPLEKDDRFRYVHLPVTGGNKIPESVEKVSESYINMVDSQMDRIIHTIITADSNVLYFCNAGKDRTGVVSALLLRHMGMTDAYILDDYMQSKENLSHILFEFVKHHPEIDIEIITPHRSYMEKFLKAI